VHFIGRLPPSSYSFCEQNVGRCPQVGGPYEGELIPGECALGVWCEEVINEAYPASGKAHIFSGRPFSGRNLMKTGALHHEDQDDD